MTLHVVGPIRAGQIDPGTIVHKSEPFSDGRAMVLTRGIDRDVSGAEILISAWPDPTPEETRDDSFRDP